MAENELEMLDERGGFGVGEDVIGDRPRRYQRRRSRLMIPDYLDWKDVDLLRQFVPERGKIMPRRISGIPAKDQRRLAKAIKRARSMAMLPFVADSYRSKGGREGGTRKP
ncbi:hypothetical protein BH20ACI2_BH20ACI2_21530 [soil metagenome]